MKTLVALGDSWTYGSELENRKMAWPYRLAEKLNCQHVLNLGTPATSIYHLLLQIAEFEESKVENPVFVVGITDEARYMFWDTQHQEWFKITGVNELANFEGMGRFIREFTTVADTMPYREFFLGTVLTWLQNYFVSHKYPYIMFKQFNSLPDLWCDSMLDRSHIHNQGISILADLTRLPASDFDPAGEPYDWNQAIMGNQYFTNKIAHPCERGHARIAEMLCALYKERYQ